MILFDYLYFWIYRCYSEGLKETDPHIYASGLVGFFQLVNILVIWGVIEDFGYLNFEFHKVHYILPVFLFYYLNHIRYKNRFEIIKQNWVAKNRKEKKQVAIILGIYIFLIFGYLFSHYYIKKALTE